MVAPIRRILRLAAASAALLLGACSDPATAPEADPATASYASSLNVNIATMRKTPSGLYIGDETIGTGATAAPGTRVLVHYTGWLVDGTRFDTSRDGDGPIDFVLGTGRVIQGWEEGLAGMKVGGKRRLVIPPSLGYGQSGFNGIPGNAILVFEVELVNIV
jgi:FKBP-type peptidyl-prolyl cis-trans isomerase FkpA